MKLPSLQGLRARARLLAAALALACVAALSAAAAEPGERGAQLREYRDAFFEAQAADDFEAMERIAGEQAAFLSEARADLEARRAAESKDPALLKDYAAVIAAHGDYDLAAEALERAAEQAPDDADAWLLLGETRMMHGQDAQAPGAARALRRCLALEPGPETAAHAYGLLGALHVRAGLVTLAREAVEEGQALGVEHPALIHAALALDIVEGRVTEASEALDEQPVVTPQAAALVERALEHLETGGQAVPNTAGAQAAYARLLFQVGQPHRSVGPLERAVTLDPGDTVRWNFLGSVYLTVGRWDSARWAFGESLALDEDQPRTREILDALEADEPPPPGDEAIDDFLPPTHEAPADAGDPAAGTGLPGAS